MSINFVPVVSLLFYMKGALGQKLFSAKIVD